MSAGKHTAHKPGKAAPSTKPAKRKRGDDIVDKSAKPGQVPDRHKKAKLDEPVQSAKA